MTEFSPELKKQLRELAKANPQYASEEDLEMALRKLLPTVEIQEESAFVKRARLILKPDVEKPTKTVEKQVPEKKQKLSALEVLFVKLLGKTEALRAKLFEGHGSQVNADKLDDLHAEELIVRAANMARGPSVGLGITKYTDAEAIAAPAGKILNSEGHSWSADGANIQVAIDDLPSRGGFVYLPAETLEIDSTITFGEKYVYLKGQGFGYDNTSFSGTVIKLANNANVDMLTIAPSSPAKWNGVIEDILFDGNKTNQASTTIDGIVEDTYARNVVYNRVAVWMAKRHGMLLKGKGGRVTDCIIEYCDTGGITTYGCQYTVFKGLLLDKNKYNFYGYTGNRMVIGNSIMRRATTTNVYLSLSLIVIEGCYISEADQHGIHIYNSDSEAICNCTIELNKQHGIIFQGAERCALIGGIIQNNSQAANNTYDGVLFTNIGTNYSLRNIVKGVQIVNSAATKQRYGINEADANQDRNIIANCIVTDNVTDQIRTQGANSIEDNNIEA